MLTRRRLLAAAALVGPASVACAQPGGTVLDRARRAGALRIGIAGERPYGFVDSAGRVTGAQPEVARAVLAGAGVDGLLAVQVPFARLLPELLAGSFDLVAAGLSVTPQRCAQVAFSRPDFLAPPAFLVPQDDPRTFRTFRTFGGVARSRARLAVLDGSAEQGWARAAGVAEDRLVLAAGPGDLVRDVAAGRADLGALTALSLTDQLSRRPGTGLEVTGPVTPVVDGEEVVSAAAFAMRPADVDLRAAVDTGLARLHASGEWLRLTAPFGLTAASIPPVELTAAALCRAG
jgi:polar amino acid transport system substrate-binding protein